MLFLFHTLLYRLSGKFLQLRSDCEVALKFSRTHFLYIPMAGCAIGENTQLMNPRSWVHYCVAPFYFVVFKGYGSHLPPQVTFCIMYVTCYKRGSCDGVWKDQSKSMCTFGGISPNACVSRLSQYLLHLGSLLLYVLCSHVLHTLLHSSQQSNDGAFKSGGERLLPNRILPLLLHPQ